MQQIDAEIRRILDEQYALAIKLLNENREKVEAMTNALMEFETIDADQINDIMEGRPVRQPKVDERSRSSGGTPPSGGAVEASSPATA